MQVKRTARSRLKDTVSRVHGTTAGRLLNNESVRFPDPRTRVGRHRFRGNDAGGRALTSTVEFSRSGSLLSHWPPAFE
jgi:hypothetical protein